MIFEKKIIFWYIEYTLLKNSIFSFKVKINRLFENFIFKNFKNSDNNIIIVKTAKVVVVVGYIQQECGWVGKTLILLRMSAASLQTFYLIRMSFVLLGKKGGGDS